MHVADNTADVYIVLSCKCLCLKNPEQKELSAHL